MQFGFVLDKLFELIETPIVERATLKLMNRFLPYSLEIFKGNDVGSVFSFGYNLLSDFMVCISCKSCNSSRKFHEMSFSTFSSSFLQTGFKKIKLIPMIKVFSTNVQRYHCPQQCSQYPDQHRELLLE